MKRKTLLALALATAPLLAFAQAAPWPSKPLKAIVPFAPGSATDLVARAVMERLSAQLGQPIVVENRAGGGTTIGEAAAAHAEPDGHTLLVQTNNTTLIPWTFSNLPYDARRDLVGILPIASVPMVVVAAPDSGIRTLADLVQAGKTRPDTVSYSSSGPGGVTHFGAERLRLAGGFTATHIPFKGSNESIREVLAGRVTFNLAPAGFALPHVKAGKLVALAAASSRRSSLLPDLPTSVEAGLPDSSYDVWIGLFAPARTPASSVQRLAEEMRKALQSPAVKERFAGLGMDEMPMSTAQFADLLARESEINRRLVQATGFRSSN